MLSMLENSLLTPATASNSLRNTFQEQVFQIVVCGINKALYKYRTLVVVVIVVAVAVIGHWSFSN